MGFIWFFTNKIPQKIQRRGAQHDCRTAVKDATAITGTDQRVPASRILRSTVAWALRVLFRIILHLIHPDPFIHGTKEPSRRAYDMMPQQSIFIHFQPKIFPSYLVSPHLSPPRNFQQQGVHSCLGATRNPDAVSTP